MDSGFLNTPIMRQGPTSRLLKRKSEKIHFNEFDSRLDQTAGPNVSFAVPFSNQTFRQPRNEMTMLMEGTMYKDGGNMMSFLNNDTVSNMTMKMGDAFPLLQSSENLFIDFLSSMSASFDGPESLDLVAELQELVTSHTENLKAHASTNDTIKNVLHNLSNEKKTWRLIGKLYHDRMLGPEESMETDSDQFPLVVYQKSEKRLVQRLFQKDSTLRQAQAVVDWLEANACDDLDESLVNYFTHATTGWENTLGILLQKGRSAGRTFVQSMDPDAPHREKLPLHDLDAQDELNLMKCLFMLIRSGQLDKAQQLCIKVGQPWRAATLEGWKLFHDPNYERDNADEKLPVEGNKNRDIWKLAAWRMTQDENLPQLERAIYSVFCGNSKQLLSVGKNWEDYLWSYTKCQIDCIVENEIREMSPREFEELPPEYWSNQRNTKTIFDLIAASTSPYVRLDLDSPYHIVQTCIIGEYFDQLYQHFDDWASREELKSDPHLLRFLTHVILVLRKIEPKFDHDKGLNILRAYATYLMQTNRVQQVAWYVSQLPFDDQISLYAEFLETVLIESDRRLVMTLAIETDLPLTQIKSRVVKNVFNQTVRENAEESEHQLMDSKRIDCLSWLLYDDFQRHEAMYQANTLIRSFIAADKYTVAKQAWSKLPEDSLQVVSGLSQEMNDGVVSPQDANTINEYLCWQVYFRAKDSFSEWFEHFHREKPKAPQEPVNPSFTDKVAHEQRMKHYNNELKRWQSSQAMQSKEACAFLKEVVTFSGGWLVDQAEQPSDEELQERLKETDYLRKQCIPEVIHLLHSVLHTTEEYDQAIGIASLVASEQYALYSLFLEDNIRDLLTKIRESSLKAMETGKLDVLGWPIEEKSS